jgi:hypothetical protein
VTDAKEREVLVRMSISRAIELGYDVGDALAEIQRPVMTADVPVFQDFPTAQLSDLNLDTGPFGKFLAVTQIMVSQHLLRVVDGQMVPNASLTKGVIDPALWKQFKAAEQEVVNDISFDPTPSEAAVFKAAESFRRAYTFGDTDDILDRASKFLDALRAMSETEDEVAEEVEAYDEYADLPILYVLVRNDLESMNPGKAIAQGTHAANQLVWEILFGKDVKSVEDFADRVRALQDKVDHIVQHDTYSNPLLYALLDWSISAGGFGTCICLEATSHEALTATIAAGSEDGKSYAVLTHDPSYPVRDGRAFYHVPLDTAGAVFGRKQNAKPKVKNHRLHP